MAVVVSEQDSFAAFVESEGPRLTHALIASLGAELGRDMAAEALAYGWENWKRIRAFDNPAGYLYRVGRNKGKRIRRPLLLPDPPSPQSEPLVEPGLPLALARLSERQRVSVMLVHGAGWTVSEAAAVLGVSPGSVYRHVERGLRILRKSLGVNTDA